MPNPRPLAFDQLSLLLVMEFDFISGIHPSIVYGSYQDRLGHRGQYHSNVCCELNFTVTQAEVVLCNTFSVQVHIFLIIAVVIASLVIEVQRCVIERWVWLLAL